MEYGCGSCGLEFPAFSSWHASQMIANHTFEWLCLTPLALTPHRSPRRTNERAPQFQCIIRAFTNRVIFMFMEKRGARNAHIYLKTTIYNYAANWHIQWVIESITSADTINLWNGFDELRTVEHCYFCVCETQSAQWRSSVCDVTCIVVCLFALGFQGHNQVESWILKS